MEACAQYTRSAQSPFLTSAENRWWGARWPIHQNPMLDYQVSHYSIDDQFAHYSIDDHFAWFGKGSQQRTRHASSMSAMQLDKPVFALPCGWNHIVSYSYDTTGQAPSQRSQGVRLQQTSTRSTRSVSMATRNSRVSWHQA